MFLQKSKIILLAILMLAQLGLLAASNTINKCDFRSEMRKLWEDHITWMRLHAVESAGNLPGATASKERLLLNQKEIGTALKPFFGDDASEEMTKLLTNHIELASVYLDNLKKKDKEKIENSKAAWYGNADQIAQFLNRMNPEWWPIEPVTFLLHDHLDLTNREFEAQLKGDWRGSIDAYEKIHEEILHISDAFAYGILKRFPDKFTDQVIN